MCPCCLHSFFWILQLEVGCLQHMYCSIVPASWCENNHEVQRIAMNCIMGHHPQLYETYCIKAKKQALGNGFRQFNSGTFYHAQFDD